MIRDFKESDFDHCQRLVNKVWQFDTHFQPPQLAKFLTRIYAGGSLAESNFRKVVEENDCILGFLFGKIEKLPFLKSEYGGFLGQIKILRELLFISGLSIRRKLAYLQKINTHEENRRAVEDCESSEVLLFVVDPDAQGKGWGKKLLHSFMDECRKYQLRRIVLETDSESNYEFYKHLGFSVKGDFHSPLLQEFSGMSGQTYIYEIDLTKTTS